MFLITEIHSDKKIVFEIDGELLSKNSLVLVSAIAEWRSLPKIRPYYFISSILSKNLLKKKIVFFNIKRGVLSDMSNILRRNIIYHRKDRRSMRKQI